MSSILTCFLFQRVNTESDVQDWIKVCFPSGVACGCCLIQNTRVPTSQALLNSSEW